ncbi:uncharacterized protein LOC117121035, partial [Anneissia japonica]|uniref:uncharacterized protein LOC117121035 n=1 Tax=Anneissia japonica TaxID=1529436 RepID=UPI0014254FCC
MLGCSNEGEDRGSGREDKRSPHKNTGKVKKKFLWNHGCNNTSTKECEKIKVQKNSQEIDGKDWKQIFEEVSSSENEEGKEDVNIMEVGDSQQDMEEFKVQNVTAALKGLEAAVDQDNTITEDSMQQE